MIYVCTLDSAVESCFYNDDHRVEIPRVTQGRALQRHSLLEYMKIKVDRRLEQDTVVLIA